MSLIILFFQILTCIVEVEANHQEANEVLIFLNSSQNLVHNFVSLYVLLKEETKLTQASDPMNLGELQGQHKRKPEEMAMSWKPMA